MPDPTIDLVECFGRAMDAYRAGDLPEAERLCREIVLAQPDHFESTHVLAVAQAGLRRYDQALASYDRALRLRPNDPDVLNNRAGLLVAMGRLEEALQCYDRAIGARPDDAQAFSNRGAVLERLERFDAALANYDRAVALRPDFAEALYNRGNVLKELKRTDAALASYDRAIALCPGHADAHNNRGQVLKDLMRYDEALASYDAALAVQPLHVRAHGNAAALRLLTGDLSRGWQHYEWRWERDVLVAAKRNFPQPQWRGDTAIAGKTILVYAEQGLGDTIQFCRYVPMLTNAGARVVLEVQPPLHELMAASLEGVQIVDKGSSLPTFDLHCPLLSLPLAFGTRLETIPAAEAYLRAPAERLAAWQARLGAAQGPRVGLVWSGNARHERDGERSIALQALLPLMDVGAAFVSLQKEIRAEDRAILQARGDIFHFGDELKDFSDTAALVAQLDLVISVDTSVAHLAAALGKPTWILLTYIPDWRWLLARDDSPWYPTARLFRQDATKAWDGVIARVGDALADFAGSGGG